MYPEFQDQVAIVTGGYKGLGGAVSLALASAGARVVIAARSRDQCAEMAGKINSTGGRAMAAQVDVTSSSSVRAMVQEVKDTWGSADLLVNNAGIQGKIDWIVNYDPDEWDRIIAVLLKGPFLCCQAVLPDMIKRRRGKIVNVAATVGDERIGYGVAAYYAAKAGLINFTRQCAAETKRYNVFVNAICPGGLDTGMSDEIIAVEKASNEFSGAQTNAGRGPRLRAPEAIAPLVLFLLSHASDMMTGRFLQASSPDDVQYLQL
jgi:NAD(P)-dependent dehydrogenase (short-subunit alcohol dehydrogenase family)